MDYFAKLSRSITAYAVSGVLATLAISGAVWWTLTYYTTLDSWTIAGVAGGVFLALLYLYARRMSRYLTEPLRTLSQAIAYVTPGAHSTPAPNLDKVRLGRELVTNLSLQVYQLASQSLDHLTPGASDKPAEAHPEHPPASDQARAVLESLPVPIFVSDKDQTVIYANPAAAQYLKLPIGDLVGKNLYSVLDFSFTSAETLDAWLSEARLNKVTASHQWDRVRLTLGDQTRRQCDLAAYYNKNNPAGAEMVLTLFDKTKFYGEDDDSIGFIALAVHELRTPLTILRGYIEVFEDELYKDLDPEMKDFVDKMQASAQQLSAFVSSILNVARVEGDQLFLELHKEDWGSVLQSVLTDMELQARVHHKKIVCKIEPDLPPVAVDRVSIYEVLNNLLDNALKYSENSDEIIVKTFRRDDGQIATTVQDFGIGIPTSIIGHLFEKFYRNHRSRTQFGGTGLGLYLSKAIVTAHGGQIWVQSKEGEGSTFGFTLQPYDQLAKTQASPDNKDIVRTAHGWIKNHSFYRR